MDKDNMWDLTPKEAVKLQLKLRGKVIAKHSAGRIKFIAGADIALSRFGKVGISGIIVYKYPELIEVERIWARGEIKFPYVPGLLSFREAPLLLKAIDRLKTRPDLIIFDGQGIAHPRRIGIASHMGLLLGLKTIGCAKSRLIGKYKEPSKDTGSFSYLYDKNEIIGAVYRTRTNVKPIYVSIGHRVSLAKAIEIIKKCCDGFRIPKPTREADKFVKSISRSCV